MTNQHEISEYIEHLPLKKKLCKGFRADDVYDVICNISSMYNELLSEAYSEMDELKRMQECMGNGFFSQSKLTHQEESIISIEESKGEAEVEKKPVDVISSKDIQKLKRVELLEILLEQSRENEELKLQIEKSEKEIESLNKKLTNRKIEIQEAGTIAEAAFKLNGVFDAAEKAAEQYLENLEELYEREKYVCTQKESEVESRCSAMMQATRERCELMKEEATKNCEDMEASVKKQCEELVASTEAMCRERERESEDRCKYLDQKAKSDVDKRWEDLSRRLEDFYTAHEGLKELLLTSKMI